MVIHWLPIRLAHEVYVLTPHQIAKEKADHSVHIFSVLGSAHNRLIFFYYTLATALMVAIAIYLKSTRLFSWIGHKLNEAGKWAPDFIRIVFGLSLIFSAMHGALFGPELPLSSFGWGAVLKPLLWLSGLALLGGIFSRYMAVLVGAIFAYACVAKGWYMLTYINYLGEAIAVCILPVQRLSLDRLWHKKVTEKVWREKSDNSMAVARVLFGLSLLYAAIYVKFIHPALSLQVVNQYHLTKYFHYQPLMVVFGAAMVELLISLLYTVGLLQRLNTLIFVTFITLSLIYFKESVWPHYMLFGLAIGIFLHRPDGLSLDKRLAVKK